MSDREETEIQALAVLEAINSLEELLGRWDEYMDVIKAVLRSRVDEVKEFAAVAGSMTPENRTKMIAMFLDDNYMFSPELQSAMARVDGLPGVAEHTEARGNEFDTQMDPLLQEFQDVLMPIAEKEVEVQVATMTNDMSKLVGGMSDGLEDMMGGMMGAIEAMGPAGEVDAEGRVRELNDIYGVRSLEDFIELKGELFEFVFQNFDDDLEELKTIKEMEFPILEVMETLEIIDRRRVLWVDSMNKELDRIAQLPGAEEEAKEAKEVMNNKLAPVIDEIRSLIDDLLKDVKPPEE